MANITAPYEADSVSFDLHRDRQALDTVIEEGKIAGDVSPPLPDEEFRPDPSQEAALASLDPVVRDQLEEDRLPDEIVQDGQREMAEEGFNEEVNTEIGRRAQVTDAFVRNAQNFNDTVGDYFAVVHDPDLTVSPALADAVRDVPDGPRLIYNLVGDPARLDEINKLSDAGSVRHALNVVRRDMGLNPRTDVSHAPAPVPTLGGRGALTPRSPSNMSYSEYKRGRLSGRIK